MLPPYIYFSFRVWSSDRTEPLPLLLVHLPLFFPSDTFNFSPLFVLGCGKVHERFAALYDETGTRTINFFYRKFIIQM